ncbi:MAG: hypothetical protein ACHQM6_00645 [Candidatus Kapaibacterium sp.]
MLKFLIIAILFTGGNPYPPVKRDAKINKKEMEKSLVFVRKDASQCRHKLKDFRTRLAELNKANNHKAKVSTQESPAVLRASK